MYDSLELIIRGFPSNFSCSIFFSSCFLFLCFEASPIVFVTSSCEKVGERKGGLDEEGYGGLHHVFLPVKVFSTYKETHDCTPYAKRGVERLKAPSGGIFNRRPVNTAGRVKNQYHCAWLEYLSGVILLPSAEPS